MDALEKALLALLLAPCALLALALVAAHVADTWDAPEYPHSGFAPDCPEWDEPLWEGEPLP